jgi:hypothetical protein
VSLDKFCEDTDECQCHGWTYDHSKEVVWAYVETDDVRGTQKMLGHHPGCPYWILPPDPSLTGLRMIDYEKQGRALAALAQAYSELYWSVNPPKDPDSDS